MTLLSVRNLCVEKIGKNFPSVIIKEVSFDINTKETLALIGQSGSGKSTVARAITQFLNPNLEATKGEIFFKNENILTFSKKKFKKLLGRDLVIIFQNPFSLLNPKIKIGSQIIETLKNKNYKKNELLDLSFHLLDLVKISDPKKCLNQYPFELSGGMQQKVSLAIAVSCKPNLIIADEPTTALDSVSQKECLSLIHNLQKEYDLSFLLITHNLALVSEHSHKIAIIHNGTIVEYGNTQEILSSPTHFETKKLIRSIPKITFYDQGVL